MPIALKTEAGPGRVSLRFAYGLFLVALTVRIWGLVRLTHSSLLIPSRGDMHFYNDWAKQVLHGQLTDHLAFYGLPGYAYLLAGLYRLFGENPFVPALLQALLDAGSAVLIYQIFITIVGSTSATATRSTSLSPHLFGALAAVAWIFFVPAEAYSVVLMPTAWVVFAFWFVVWRIVRTSQGLRVAECFYLAVLIGLTATAVATILCVAPLIVAALIFRRQQLSWHKIVSRIGVLFLGLAVGTSPCWIHNYFVARDPVLLSAHSGINFWIGNNPQATGYPRFPPGLRAGQAAMLQDSIDQAEAAAGRPLKRAEVSKYWSTQASNYIATHFADWLRLLALKLRNFWSAFQYDDLSIVTVLREQNVIFPGPDFGLIAALAIPGIFFGWFLAPRSRWILAAIVLTICALLPVFITERYRLVAVPGLIILAVFGLSTLWNAILAKQVRSVALYLVVLIAATSAVAWPQRNPSLWALDAYNSGWQALESNNLALAERKLALAHAYVPDNSETLFALGNLRLAQNNTAAAQSFYHAVLALDPKHKSAFNNLGVIALDATDYETAETCFRQAATVDPRNAKTHFLLAKTLLAKSDLAGARAEITAAIALKSDQPEFIDLKNRIDSMQPH